MLAAQKVFEYRVDKVVKWGKVEKIVIVKTQNYDEAKEYFLTLHHGPIARTNVMETD